MNASTGSRGCSARARRGAALARYYAPDGSAPDEFELYDRETDPAEAANLAWSGHQRHAEQEAAYQRLLALLEEVEQTRLQPLA